MSVIGMQIPVSISEVGHGRTPEMTRILWIVKLSLFVGIIDCRLVPITLEDEAVFC